MNKLKLYSIINYGGDYLNIIKNEIKSYIVASGWSIKKLVERINENKPDHEKTTSQNLSNKLSRGTIKYSEVKEIAEIIGYKIKWEKEDLTK